MPGLAAHLFLENRNVTIQPEPFQKTNNNLFIRIRFVMACFGIILALSSGCSLFRSRPFSPFKESFPVTLTPDEISRRLVIRHSTHDEIWARGKITVSGPSLNGKSFFNATLLFQEPDKLRIRGSRMITSTLFEFIIAGNEAAVSLNMDKQWYSGMRRELLERPEITLGLDPFLVPQAILIQQFFMAGLRNADFNKWCSDGNYYTFLWTSSGVTRGLMVRKKDLLVREAGIYGADGRLAARIRYNAYEIFDGEVFPSDMEILLSCTGLKARVEISEYKQRPGFDPRVFSLEPPRNFTRYPLSALSNGPSPDTP